MAGGVDVEGDDGSVRLAEDAIGEVGDLEGRGAGGNGETVGGESVGPDRKCEVGEALEVCGGEGGGCGSERRRSVGEKVFDGWRAARQIGVGERSHSNLVACG